MTSAQFEFLVCDDWISCKIEGTRSFHGVGTILRQQDFWQEVVAGMDSFAVQFDPAKMMPSEAKDHLRKQLENVSSFRFPNLEPAYIPVCYEPVFALDRDRVAQALAISPDEVADWHNGLRCSVTMLGFMPGFAYLDCDQTISDIGRLTKPRQKVAAGSIGIIGSQSCIYSFDSPGGWPIIGRTPLKLFDPNRAQAPLLSPGQEIQFKAISMKQYRKIAAVQSDIQTL